MFSTQVVFRDTTVNGSTDRRCFNKGLNPSLLIRIPPFPLGSRAPSLLQVPPLPLSHLGLLPAGLPEAKPEPQSALVLEEQVEPLHPLGLGVTPPLDEVQISVAVIIR